MAEDLKDHLYALIICGGAGTRLWPRSIQKTPKQFLEKFYGEKTLFTQTVERASLLAGYDKIFVITLGDYVDEVIKYGPNIPVKNIITEPFGKNTAMAVGVGAAYIKKIDPQAVVMNFWSDAAIKENDLFSKSMTLAAETAFSGDFLVTVGLKPMFPHTGLGYIETGEKFGNSDVYKVSSFKEKPDLEIAKQFLSAGNFYWSTGIYVWSVGSVFAAFAKHSPQIFALLQKIYDGINTAQEKEIILKAYEEVEATPVDIAVSEKADNLLLVPAVFSWSDIGDWKVAYAVKEKDADGNIIEKIGEKGWHLGVETKNCLVETKNKLIATVGVSDLVIIETDEAILICNRDKAQDVKKIVLAIKEAGESEYL